MDTSDERQGTRLPGEVAQINALLFIEAKNFAQAVEIAEAHPAVAFGANVEVRSWVAPRRGSAARVFWSVP